VPQRIVPYAHFSAPPSHTGRYVAVLVQQSNSLALAHADNGRQHTVDAPAQS
jgi:hypothetical protein